MIPIPPAIIHLVVLTLAGLTRADGIWNIDIDEEPAPPPDQGPPFSAHAIRDPSRLAIEVIGVVVAYVGTTFIIGSLLVTIGRRSRREAMSPYKGPPIEMLKPSRHAFESPVSPSTEQRPWYSPRRIVRRLSISNSMRSGSNPGSPGIDSLASFDARVLETDKRQRQDELERLYAAVMDHEEHLKHVAQTSQDDLAEQRNREDIEARYGQAPDKCLPRLMTDIANRQVKDDFSFHQSPVSPVSPNSQRSPIRAIYPPDSFMPSIRPSSTTTPIRAEYPRAASKSDQRHFQLEHENVLPTAIQPGSPISQSHSMRSNDGRQMKRLRRSLKKIDVDVLNQFSSGDNEADSAKTPLAPRQLADSDLVVTPKSERIATPSTYRSVRSIPPGINEDSEERSSGRAMPATAVQRMEQYDNDPYHHRLATSTPTQISSPKMLLEGRSGAPAQPIPKLKANASNATLGSLPFRTMASNNELASPGLVTKTTYLERRNQFLGPRTGVATPYSPYMPFTPLTPVTPRLISRQERRQIEREKGRRVLAEGDQVIDENEMWA
ncbi:hypothetical protein K461DRAFT_278019 [Myriangium duriaei CBS 260.36]|uniref:Uncharacterized protein n=1 Tax=Myriangium duriaei CBS 260.36 TaxID=1168546 RepID=A0A9P4MHG7_9PEZI|nr:hypothetical protein K461DRAFT_278019 [Myriangium duriaei CBS 260.36]